MDHPPALAPSATAVFRWAGLLAAVVLCVWPAASPLAPLTLWVRSPDAAATTSPSHPTLLARSALRPLEAHRVEGIPRPRRPRAVTAPDQSRTFRGAFDGWWLAVPALVTAVAFGRNRAPEVAVWATSGGDRDEDADEVRRGLIEEVESPWRKFRYFFYLSFAAAAGLSAFVELPRLLAALGGINADLLPSSVTNLAVSAGILGLIAVAYRQDRQTQLKKLDRIKVGSTISTLRVQLSDTGERVKLSDLRAGRGRATRVVIVAASPDLLRRCLAAARAASAELVANDLLLVPVSLPAGTDLSVEPDLLAGPHLALPLGNWADVINAECERAQEQGLDAQSSGFTMVIKKNGRVGQRIVGLPPIERMVADVQDRKARGMDIDNI